MAGLDNDNNFDNNYNENSKGNIIPIVMVLTLV